MINNVEKHKYGLWLARLDELRKDLGKELMPFPDIDLKLCRNFQLKQQLVRKFLHILWQEGYIEISCCHGVKISDSGKKILHYLDDMNKD